MNHSTPAVPWSPPTWLTPDRIVLATVAAFAAAAALPAVWWIPPARSEIRGEAGAVAVMATSTALLSLILVRFALRAATPHRASLRCIVGGAIAGALNAGLAFAGIGIVCHGDWGRAVGGFAAVGLGLAVLGVARRRARLAWLARVAAGAEPGWRIDVCRDDEEEAWLLPLVRPGGRLQDGVLRYRAPGQDRYRSASPSVPAALTTLPGLRPDPDWVVREVPQSAENPNRLETGQTRFL